MVAEIAKAHLHRGRRPRLSFYRDRSQLEIDLVLEKGSDLVLVEVKSAQTPSGQYFYAFERFAATLEGQETPRITGRVVGSCTVGRNHSSVGGGRFCLGGS